MLAAIHGMAQEFPRVSPKASVSQVVGLTTITITYSRPGVKGRVIWGELVPYEKVWRTGANEATTFEVSDAVRINGHPLPAGKYALFTIPRPDRWTIIFNTKWNQWGAFDYNPDEDALRIDVRPERTDQHREWMMFSFENLTPTSADVVLHWEKLRVKFTVTVDVVPKVIGYCRKTLAHRKPDDWRTPLRCADFCMNHKAHLEEALRWIDDSIAVQENYFNLRVKAYLLAYLGRLAEAIAVGQRAVQLGRERGLETNDLEQRLRQWQKQAQ